MSDTTKSGPQTALLNADEAVLILLDHQAGLLQTVKDISIAELRANTTIWAKLARVLDIRLITSAPALDAKAAGYNVQPVIGASGEALESPVTTLLSSRTSFHLQPIRDPHLMRRWRQTGDARPLGSTPK